MWKLYASIRQIINLMTFSSFYMSLVRKVICHYVRRYEGVQLFSFSIDTHFFFLCVLGLTFSCLSYWCASYSVQSDLWVDTAEIRPPCVLALNNGGYWHRHWRADDGHCALEMKFFISFIVLGKRHLKSFSFWLKLLKTLCSLWYIFMHEIL